MRNDFRLSLGIRSAPSGTSESSYGNGLTRERIGLQLQVGNLTLINLYIDLDYWSELLQVTILFYKTQVLHTEDSTKRVDISANLEAAQWESNTMERRTIWYVLNKGIQHRSIA